MPEFADKFIDTVEKSRLLTPGFTIWDLDKTLFFDDPEELALSINELNRVADDRHNMFSTINTQHLADTPTYQSIWKLRWTVGGKSILPPIYREDGTTVAWANRDGTGPGEWRFTNSEYADYHVSVRPRIISALNHLFPGEFTLENGLVMVGAILKDNSTKKKKKVELENYLEKTDPRLLKKIYVAEQGRDLDIMPHKLGDQGKEVGIRAFLELLNEDPRYIAFRPERGTAGSRMVIVDDKAYAAASASTHLTILGGGALGSAASDQELTELLIHSGNQVTALPGFEKLLLDCLKIHQRLEQKSQALAVDYGTDAYDIG